MPVYNLTEYRDNCSKTSGILCDNCKYEPALAANGDIADFIADNATTSLFEIKAKITGETGDNCN